MKTRIVVLSEVFPPRQGGSGRWLWELYRRLDVPIRVVAAAAPGDAAFDRASPVPVERLSSAFTGWGLRAWRAYLGAARHLVRACRAHHATVVHCGRCLPEGLTALLARRRSGLPYWCFAHGEELTLAETSRELAWLTRRVLAASVRVVANSEHTKRLLVERWGVPEDRIAVLTPGVDTERFTPAARDERARARLGWTGRRVILTVGALQKRKGQDMLVRALPDIRQHCPDVLYAIAGEGWERPYLEQLAADCGVSDAVQFLGVPDDHAVVELYQQCDLFALPNRQVGWDLEGFGIVLIEAQACAAPVIAGQSGGAPETLRNGETGLVVACERPEELAAACVNLLEDAVRRRLMGQRGRAWVVERFDWQALAVRAARLLSVSSEQKSSRSETSLA